MSLVKSVKHLNALSVRPTHGTYKVAITVAAVLAVTALVALRPRKKDPLPPGIVNIGNSCYMNSVLQAICMLKLNFAHWSEIIDALGKVASYPLRPEIPLNRDQQDAHEFLIALLTSLRSANIKQLPTSFYSLAPWELLTSEQIICTRCSKRGMLVVLVHSCISVLPGQPFSPNEDCRLEGYRCDRCNQLDTSYKHIRVLKWPKILFIHIQRLNFGSKDETAVPIPRKFNDLHLVSLIEHLGGAAGGHYVAFRRWRKGSWIRASDEQVGRSSWSEVKSRQRTAYLLVYQ